MININIDEQDQILSDTKQTIINTLNRWKILNYSYINNRFKIEINDYETYNEILRLFYYLYVLEKMHSHKYPISKDDKDKNDESDKRHLRSIIEKDKQAYILKIGDYTVFVTYFGYHKSNINPFDKKRLLVGDFKKAFGKIERPKHTKSPNSCPIILMFRYHLSEKSNIINKKLYCNPSIDFSKLTCEISSEGYCRCLEEIEKAILNDPENVECNLRIFGGTPAFFKANYDIIKDLINLEFLNERGYEPIFNFLLGCYISDKIKAEFNSNVKIKFDDITIIDDVDIIALCKKAVIIIETTREHQIYNNSSKLKKVISDAAAIYLIANRFKINNNIKYILLTLTPENEFKENNRDYITSVNKLLINFIHAGIPDDIARKLKLTASKRPEYFSPSLVHEILKYQLDKFFLNFLF